MMRLVGIDPRRADAFARYLADHDPCFGQHYAATVDECKRCIAPVIIDGTLQTMADACRAVTRGGSGGGRIARLSAQDVRARLAAGDGVAQLFCAVLGGEDAQVHGREARNYVKQQLDYLARRGEVVPDVPPWEDLAHDA